MRYTYTKEDIDFLKEYYPDGNWDKINERFPNLSKTAIYRKCQKLSIKSNNTHRNNWDISKTRKYWTDEETQILIDNFSKIPIDELLNLLPNRNINMIMSKARIYNLKSFHILTSTWKEEEVKFIKDNWLIMPDIQMAKILNKTQRAIKWKREECGLFRQQKNVNSYLDISHYLRGQNSKWKKESMKICRYECVLTKSKNFEVHHLYGVSLIIKDVFSKYPKYKDRSFESYSSEDLSFLTEQFLLEQQKYPLGVCVDKDIHKLFHSLYGKSHNTPEQWYQFEKDFKKGEYNNMLKN